MKATRLPADKPTPREAYVLRRLADGRQISQIARELESTGSAVSNVVTRFGRRMGIVPGSTPQIVAVAVRRGWLEDDLPMAQASGE